MTVNQQQRATHGYLVLTSPWPEQISLQLNEKAQNMNKKTLPNEKELRAASYIAYLKFVKAAL